jgi:hypothetical protein
VGYRQRDAAPDRLACSSARETRCRGDKHYSNLGVKYTGPDGVTVDVSESGWVGATGFNPKA